ncbi:OapC/ArvC family zinc-ribbon domain-containing protein [Halobellus rarus]|uniref:Zn-ribbon containing protein n=1 Tax=Halobellus rarus TaxID=1126237 RepID=A0ABD6CJZ9_9EURY|nr:Zn-ribbon containing protein [Halobellus rarus]
MPHECTNCGRVFDDGSKEMLSGCPNCGGNKFQFRPSSATDSTDSTESPSKRSEPAGETEPDPRSRPSEGAEPTSSSTAWSDAAERAVGDEGESEPTPVSDPSPDSDPTSTRISASSREWPNQREGSGEATPSTPEDPRDSAGDDKSRTESRESDSESRASDSDDSVDVDDGPATSTDDDSIEDTAQASARSEVVSPDELAAASRTEAEEDGPTDPDAPSANAPDREAAARPSDADGRVIEPSSDDRPDLEDLRAELNEQFESIRIVAPGEYELNLMELYDRTEYIISLQEDGRYVIEVPDTWDTTPGGAEDT